LPAGLFFVVPAEFKSHRGQQLIAKVGRAA
jgi:hypothetical protein